MTRKPPKFNLPDFRRGLIGARQAGAEVDRVEMKPDGTIVLVMKGPAPPAPVEAA